MAQPLPPRPTGLPLTRRRRCVERAATDDQPKRGRLSVIVSALNSLTFTTLPKIGANTDFVEKLVQDFQPRSG
jgi:hypothetical protein